MSGIIPPLSIVALYNFREYLDRQMRMEEKVGSVDLRTSLLESELPKIKAEVRESRIDSLRYQEYMARRNKDYGFAADLAARLQAAEGSRR